MRDRRSAGHHVSVELMIRVARQFEQAAGAFDERVEPFASAIVGEAGAVHRPLERQHQLELPAKLQRDFCGDLVGAICDRRDEAQLARPRGKTVALLFEQVRPSARNQRQRLAESFPQPVLAARGEHVRPVARDADAEHERNRRRPTKEIGVFVRAGGRDDPSVLVQFFSFLIIRLAAKKSTTAAAIA